VADLAFLSNIGELLTDAHKKAHQNGRKTQPNESTRLLVAAASTAKRQIDLQILPHPLSKRQRNTSYFHRNSDTIFWRLEFRLHLCPPPTVPDASLRPATATLGDFEPFPPTPAAALTAAPSAPVSAPLPSAPPGPPLAPVPPTLQNFTNTGPTLVMIGPRVAENLRLSEAFLSVVHPSLAHWPAALLAWQAPLQAFSRQAAEWEFLLRLEPSTDAHPVFLSLAPDTAVADALCGQRIIEFPVIWLRRRHSPPTCPHFTTTDSALVRPDSSDSMPITSPSATPPP
jgi:hypothetical protein